MIFQDWFKTGVFSIDFFLKIDIMGPKVKFLVSSDDELSLKTHVQIYIYYVIYNFTVTEENFQLRQSNSNSMRIG